MIHAMAGHWEMGALHCLSRDEREEALWIDRARTGDDAAYRRLLGQYRVRVVRLAAHVLRESGGAEDVAEVDPALEGRGWYNKAGFPPPSAERCFHA